MEVSEKPLYTNSPTFVITNQLLPNKHDIGPLGQLYIVRDLKGLSKEIAINKQWKLNKQKINWIDKTNEMEVSLHYCWLSWIVEVTGG